MATQEPDVRVFVEGNYEIVYQLSQKEIMVVMIWDSRQNPDDLPIQKI